jgi:hypothetical protein
MACAGKARRMMMGASTTRVMKVSMMNTLTVLPVGRSFSRPELSDLSRGRLGKAGVEDSREFYGVQNHI